MQFRKETGILKAGFGAKIFRATFFTRTSNSNCSSNCERHISGCNAMKRLLSPKWFPLVPTHTFLKKLSKVFPIIILVSSFEQKYFRGFYLNWYLRLQRNISCNNKFRKKNEFLGFCADFSRSLTAVFSARLSKLLSTCPKAYFGNKLQNGSQNLYFYGLRSVKERHSAEVFQQGCQSCDLPVWKTNFDDTYDNICCARTIITLKAIKSWQN